MARMVQSFFIGITKNGYSLIPAPDALDLHITTPSTDIISFYVEDTSGILYNGTVAPDNSTTINLDFSYIVTDSTYSNRNKGIHVYTDNGGLISVLVVTNIILGSTNVHVAYPHQELNVQQYVYYTISTKSILSYTSSLTLLVGTADDTTVIINSFTRYHHTNRHTELKSSLHPTGRQFSHNNSKSLADIYV